MKKLFLHLLLMCIKTIYYFLFCFSWSTFMSRSDKNPAVKSCSHLLLVLFLLIFRSFNQCLLINFCLPILVNLCRWTKIKRLYVEMNFLFLIKCYQQKNKPFLSLHLFLPLLFPSKFSIEQGLIWTLALHETIKFK